MECKRGQISVWHGTSSSVLSAVLKGVGIKRAFSTSNVSLGGTYVAKSRALADVYAANAAAALGGTPVVLEMCVDRSALLPDEDWVVRGARARPSPRLRPFWDDLFEGYGGDGFSLSDHYKERYDELNRVHGITWKDSWTYGFARISRPLSISDVQAAAQHAPRAR